MPDFQLGEFCWQAKCQLDCWAGFGRSLGVDEGLAGDSTSSGHYTLTFAPEGRDRAPLSDGELETIEHVLGTASEVAPAVLEGIYRHYCEIFDDFAQIVVDENLIMPALDSPAGLRDLISLTGIAVHPRMFRGQAYVGYEFFCSWESEHGLGVLMHGDRVVRVGHISSAFTLWMVDEDIAVQKASAPLH